MWTIHTATQIAATLISVIAKFATRPQPLFRMLLIIHVIADIEFGGIGTHLVKRIAVFSDLLCLFMLSDSRMGNNMVLGENLVRVFIWFYCILIVVSVLGYNKGVEIKEVCFGDFANCHGSVGTLRGWLIHFSSGSSYVL